MPPFAMDTKKEAIMSGHSKWATTKHRKAAQDAKRSALFSKLSRNITVAAKEGGDPNPDNNASLAAAIEKAKGYSLPKDKIKTAIDKAFGSGKDAANYETVVYEGYGPCGVAVIVETMTDNRNRTASDMRHYFDKYGGNLGASGCVAWSFDQKGVLVIDNEDGDYEEDTVMEAALEAGASDFEAEEECFTIYTDPDDFNSVVAALTAQGYSFVSAQVEMVPQNYTKLENEDDVKNMQKLLDMLDDDDDVQNVWHNWEQD